MNDAEAGAANGVGAAEVRAADRDPSTRAPARARGRLARARAGTLLLAGAGLVALLLPAAGCRLVRVSETAETGEEESDLRVQIAAMLDRSARAWNRGDLLGFMSDYERSQNTTYIGASGLIVGWEAIRDRYAPAFAPGAERDSLRFEDLRVRALDRLHALATARYVLYRDDRVTASGPFTLVLLGVEGEWRIVHDHSSSDPPPADSGAAS